MKGGEIGRPMTQSAEVALREVLRLMQAHDWRGADQACRRLTAQFPEFPAGWFAASHIATALRSPAAALEAIETAVRAKPADIKYLMRRAQCLLALNRRRDALEVADAVERLGASDPAAWDALGTLRSYANDQTRALAAYDRALALAPNDPQFTYNRAAVRRFLGDLEGAEADYDRVIALKPSDYEAYLNRTELRVQTADRNHVTQLEALVRRGIPDWNGDVQIRFALAKEYEDLGNHDKSFEYLQSGAKERRQHLQYDVSVDVSTVDWIIEAFPVVPAKPDAGSSMEAPIFIVGLPRSGTTLVERILSSHSAVSSAGELDCFALAIVDAARRRSGQAQLPRQRLVEVSATLDFAALGHDYLRRARASLDFGADRRFIDKMPLNYLYCGLIGRALPNARIIHLTRHPMAVCYAMYKTLFKQGYPFSYDLGEIAQYYAAYRRLMRHWHAVMPGSIHDVSYERLIADQRGASQELVAFCGLDWEEACAAFHQNTAASRTASASQIRRPLYETSVSQWRHYQAQLATLGSELRAAGLSVES
jgi:tetratricopeptide (TPR) repeat protein